MHSQALLPPDARSFSEKRDIGPDLDFGLTQAAAAAHVRGQYQDTRNSAGVNRDDDDDSKDKNDASCPSSKRWEAGDISRRGSNGETDGEGDGKTDGDGRVLGRGHGIGVGGGVGDGEKDVDVNSDEFALIAEGEQRPTAFLWMLVFCCSISGLLFGAFAFALLSFLRFFFFSFGLFEFPSGVLLLWVGVAYMQYVCLPCQQT
jgi:hypothetical protein